MPNLRGEDDIQFDNIVYTCMIFQFSHDQSMGKKLSIKYMINSFTIVPLQPVLFFWISSVTRGSISRCMNFYNMAGYYLHQRISMRLCVYRRGMQTTWKWHCSLFALGLYELNREITVGFQEIRWFRIFWYRIDQPYLFSYSTWIPWLLRPKSTAKQENWVPYPDCTSWYLWQWKSSQIWKELLSASQCYLEQSAR